MKVRFLPMLVTATLLAACGAAEGTGQLSIRVSGEEAVKKGFPLDEDGHRLEFADGWSMRFDKYIVGVGKVRVRGVDRTVAAETDEVVVADLVNGDPTIFTFEDLPAQRWPRLQFEIVAPTAESRNVNGVSTEDFARMVEHGYNYWIEGEATKGTRRVTFAWGLENPVRGADCTNGDDGTQGVIVRRSSAVDAEITVHIEHMFWNKLGAEGGTMRFEAIAAMADEDGHVTFDALADQSLTEPTDAGGEPLEDPDGTPVFYDPTSFPPTNLRDFLLFTSSYQAHLNGEGLCTITRLWSL